MSTLPRGLRNHNPLNIKIGNDWRGEVDMNTDGVFEQFTDDKYGYRAAFIILRKYIRKYGRNTIKKIVDSWSPDGRYLQDAYMNAVSEYCGVSVNTPISFDDRRIMVAIVRGMARVENGMEVNELPVIEGYELACKV